MTSEAVQTNFESEYASVRHGGAGLIDLSQRSRILVSGADAVMFLNGLITNDMKTLAANSWMPAAFANVQGRLIAAVRVFNLGDRFLIDTEDITRQKVVELLSRFTLAGDFRVTDVTTELAACSLQGAKAAQVIGAIFTEETASLEPKRMIVAKVNEHDVTITPATHTAESGFDLFVDATRANEFSEALINAGAKPISRKVIETLRIEAGLPRFGIDMDENTVLSEANLDDAISFTKGCYVGQEIIIRIKHRGHVAKKFSGIRLDNAFEIVRESPIFSDDNQQIGRVTSSTFSPSLNSTIALGYVKFGYLQAGTRVRVASEGKEIAGAVVELPFVRGSWFGNQ